MRRMMILIAILFLPMGDCGHLVAQSIPDGKAKLTMLVGQTVAVWPLAVANLDLSVAETVEKEYSDRGKFLDALSLKLSKRLFQVTMVDSVASDKVLASLGKDEAGRTVLNPALVLGTLDGNAKLAQAKPHIDLLSGLAILEGVRFLVFPRDVVMSRETLTSQGAPGAFGRPTGGVSIIMTKAKLRLAVIDLDTKSIVWDGCINAESPSRLFKGTALHNVEDDLARAFLRAVQGF